MKLRLEFPGRRRRDVRRCSWGLPPPFVAVKVAYCRFFRVLGSETSVIAKAENLIGRSPSFPDMP